MKGLEIVRYLRGALPLDVGVIYAGNTETPHGALMQIFVLWMDAAQKKSRSGLMLLPVDAERSREQMSDVVESFLNAKRKIDTAPSGSGH